MTALSIGRSSSCDIVLDNPTVSRRHAVLTAAGDGTYRYVDTGSTSGSYRMANGIWRSVTEAEVRDGDHLRLGDHETTVAALLERAGMPGRRAASVTERMRHVDGLLDGEHPGRPASKVPPEDAGQSKAIAAPEPPLPRTVVERDPATGRVLVRPR
jgi:pSer/pThr/pTyr-binding forkhead associated (FHA) protein